MKKVKSIDKVITLAELRDVLDLPKKPNDDVEFEEGMRTAYFCCNCWALNEQDCICTGWEDSE
jgi:hypothetical protein